MKILIACEFSGIVRDAFIAHGHQAVSCDLLSSEKPGPHIIANVKNLLSPKWDMMIAFPPCTYLTRAGAAYYNNTILQSRALDFVQLLMNAPIAKIAIENPPGAIGSKIRPADDSIQPWQFGHKESKQTMLWLKGLPPLYPTHIIYDAPSYQAGNLWPSPNRWKERSRTFTGIAEAMAEQWGA